MAVSVQMPALGESVTEGTVTRWLKQEGDTVEVDEPLLEVSTDKVDTEIPSPAAGVLTKIVAQEDDTVEVGGELAVIGDAGEGGGDAAAPARRRAEPEPEPRGRTRAPSRARAEGRARAGSACRVWWRRATSVVMPELGESVTEGTVTRWLKKVGDSVEVDEPLVEVSTDKVDTEIPSPVAGTLLSHHRRGGRHRRRRRRAGQDRRRRRGTRIRTGAQARAQAGTQGRAQTRAEARAQARARRCAGTATQARAQAGTRTGSGPGGGRPCRGTGRGRQPVRDPAGAKARHREQVDLAAVKGTGVGGRIRKQDVLAAAEAKKAPAPAAAARRSRCAQRSGSRRRLPARWRTCAAPRRRPTGSGRSPPRRPANRCRPPRSSPRPTRST